MLLKSGKELVARLSGMLQEKYQVHRYSVDLTVKSISEADPSGRVDFGGNEYSPAGRIVLLPQRERPEDRYEWWTLSRGCYFVQFNETLALADDEIALLQANSRLIRAGGAHMAEFLRGRVEPLETLLLVNVLRLQIKQNARISLLRLFQVPEAAAPRVAAKPKAKGRAPAARKRR